MRQRTVLITGGGSGIGRAVAKRFYAAGHNVLVVSLLESELESLRQELEGEIALAAGQCLHTLCLDLTAGDAAQQVVDFSDGLNLRVDVLINNAGFGLHGPHVDADAEQLKRMLMLNVVAVSSLCYEFANKMKASSAAGEGPFVIINVGSTSAFQPLPMLAAYAASKSFVVSFSEALALELSPYNIEVHCICPGTTKTPFLDVAGLGGDDLAFGSTAYVAQKIAMPVECVADQVYGCIGLKQTTIVPGFVNNVHYQLMHWLPKPLTRPLVNRLFNR